MATRRSAGSRSPKKARRLLDARPDTVDFRDKMFVPTLIEVPPEMSLAVYLERYHHATGQTVPILDQGQEGACTGFGLAAVCNFLLGVRKVRPESGSVSPYMFYSMAKRYDEWRGEDYDGSSARGAMKGWLKHGVCSAELWPAGHKEARLTDKMVHDAARRPLGAYFRVNHKDLVAMHTALAEVGVLYASASVHTGWDDVPSNGHIKPGGRLSGGHAFAIVGFDETGFWLQNSWGRSWGQKGFAHLAYEDWLDHGSDIWVARLGAPVRIDDAQTVGTKLGGVVTSRLSFPDIRPHVVSIGNDGTLRQEGTYGNTEDDLRALFETSFPRVTQGWRKPRILLYAHGGLVAEDNALQRVENYLQVMLQQEIYPLCFVWKTDFWTTITNMLKDCLNQRRAEGALDATKDFMLDRLDDTLERIARLLHGQSIWNEMKENALLSTLKAQGGASLAAQHLADLLKSDSRVEVHVAGHSAGSIFMAPLVQLLTTQGPIDTQPIEQQTRLNWDARNGLGVTIKTCTMWAPACTVGLFKAGYLPAIRSGSLQAYAQFNLTDAAEQDDNCAAIYNKSLLYLVSNALEDQARQFFKRDGTPILGMDKFVSKDDELGTLFRSRKADYVTAPNHEPFGDVDASDATAHGAFDDDKATVQATVNRILGKPMTAGRASFRFEASESALRRRRKALN